MKLDLSQNYFYLSYFKFWISPFYSVLISNFFNVFNINFYIYFVFSIHAENHWFVLINKKEFFSERFFKNKF